SHFGGLCSSMVRYWRGGTVLVRPRRCRATSTLQISSLWPPPNGIVLANRWPRPGSESPPFTISGHKPPDQEKSYGSFRRVQDNQGKRGQVRRPSLYRYQRQGTARHRSREGVRRRQIQGRALLRR